MMDALLLSNLFAHAAQVAAIAALGTLLVRVVRIDSAPVRYAYWRLLAAVCVLLPWLQGRAPLPTDQITPTAPASIDIGLASSADAGSSVAGAAGVEWTLWLSVALIAGVAIRSLWIVAGLWRLRRLRLSGRAADDAYLADLQEGLGTRADIRYVDDLAQPLTFGARRPVVLLPERLREQPIDVQRAVACHELHHVRRRDWCWLLAEEGVQSALWFHPGIWWLIAQVQLAREEVVDHLVVATTGARRSYIEALMTFADETPLAAAPAFARRHHLFRRILLVSKEGAMSPRRIAFSCLVAGLVVAAGGSYVVRAFPLSGAAAAQLQEPQNVNPITPENPIPRRLSFVNPTYPAQYLGSGLVVMVSVQLVLDQSGAVADARVLTNIAGTRPAQGTTLDLEPFRAAALDAGRRWLYAPPSNPPIAVTATFTFSEQEVRSVQGGELRFSPGERVLLPPAGGAGGRGGRAAAPVLVPDWTGSAPERARELAGAARELQNAGSTAPTGGAGGAAVPGPPPAPPAPIAGAPIRVGGNIRPPQQVRRVAPVYPPIAQNARVQGVVILELRVGVDGRVEEARVLRSIPLLDQAAIDAVMQWEYSPTLLNGAPVPILMTVTVQFTLPTEVAQ
jgi:TonB family protein